MNYKIVTWPDIQDYMIKYPDYKEKTFFDADKNVWLVPEYWETDKELESDFSGIDIKPIDIPSLMED